jgi:hypothetical protein
VTAARRRGRLRSLQMWQREGEAHKHIKTTQEQTDCTCACLVKVYWEHCAAAGWRIGCCAAAWGHALLTSVKSSEEECDADKRAGGEKRSGQNALLMHGHRSSTVTQFIQAVPIVAARCGTLMNTAKRRGQDMLRPSMRTDV